MLSEVILRSRQENFFFLLTKLFQGKIINRASVRKEFTAMDLSVPDVKRNLKTLDAGPAEDRCQT